MRVDLKGTHGSWEGIYRSTLNTVGKEPKNPTPSESWKEKLIRAEHSPIRKRHYELSLVDIPYWVSTHFVRHKIGVEHFIKTQRTDRTNIDRDVLPQGNKVTHEMDINAHALINMSRKRLCHQASKETRQVMKMIVSEVNKVDECVAKSCVKECVYRGFCPEMFPCGYHLTEAFKKEIKEYRGE